MEGDTLCLRWNEFETNIKQGFSELRSNEDFFDVTLACGSRQIKAHRVILSACSSFFRSLLKSIRHDHPFLYLRGIDDKHLESLLCFMYNGEVRVQQEELDHFLLVAQELKVNGLIQESSQGPLKAATLTQSPEYILPKEEISAEATSSKRRHLMPTPPAAASSSLLVDQEEEEEDEDDGAHDMGGGSGEEIIFINNYDMSEDNNESNEPMEHGDKNNGMSEYELLDAELMKYVSPRGSNNMHNCLKCSYSSPRQLNVKRHVEARHFLTDGFRCKKCPRVFKTRDTRSKHFLKQHKGEPVYYSTAKL